ncbi:MAG: Bud site selection protein bud4 [Bogoriella megaspora]|nr:MAG: Bud site selection protein bud4 [Bogoriella megaspora]
MPGSLRKNHPLSEINPMERRRNSPSFHQSSEKPSFQRDSSPFEPSPFSKGSSKILWPNREGASPTRMGPLSPPIQDEQSPSKTRRASIEKLQKASRVKNSNMFAREHKNEYDPASVSVIERPLAAGRPFKSGMKENSFENPTDAVPSDFRLHRPTKSLSNIPIYSPNKSQGHMSASGKSSPMPFKHGQQPYDPESSIFSDNAASQSDIDPAPAPTPRSRVRHAKSVTFDTEAPVINEYEEQTPEPSSIASGSRAGSYDSNEEFEDDYSFDRASSADHEDSFDESLEDTEKTPVVLPEDWRHMSPNIARTDLVEPTDDVFDQDESPVASPSNLKRPSNVLRSDSSLSDESRPLPPVPNPFSRGRRDSGSLRDIAERMSTSQRTLPMPPRPSSVSKADILGMRDGSLSLDDRLRLMALQDPEQKHVPDESEHDAQATSNSDDTATSRGRVSDIGVPRISRESILRKVKSRSLHDDFNYSSPVGSERGSPERSYGDIDDLDPDVPIPSREASSNFDENVPASPEVKKERDGSESEVDVYAIPDMYSEPPEDQVGADYGRESSVLRYKIDYPAEDDGDDESRYSPDADKQLSVQQPGFNDDGPPTPTQDDFRRSKGAETINEDDISEIIDMSEFESYLHHQEFDRRAHNFVASSPPSAEDDPASHAQKLAENLEYLQRNITPEEQEQSNQELEPPSQYEDDRSGTPDSVVHHFEFSTAEARDSPVIPEPIATIKSSGGSKLKTRPSHTPADLMAMAAVRRQVSGEKPPPIPTRSEKRLSQQLIFDSYQEPERTGTSGSDGSDMSHQSANSSTPGNESSIHLDIPVGGFSDDLGLGLRQEFDRVIESQKVAYTQYLQQLSQQRHESPKNHSFSSIFHHQQKNAAEYVGGQGFSPHRNPSQKLTRSQKGYLMRQNTKVVVASNRQVSDEKKKELADLQRTSSKEEPTHPSASAPGTRGTRSAGSSPRKPSPNKAWATEPWNGRIRRKSVRVGSASQKRAAMGAAPPMPGQESAMGKVDEALPSTFAEETDDGVERGRLFVKVVGVKDLDLPLPRSEKTHFQLTLDNGLHCVTTTWLELGHAAPIGQEFELVVLNDLEFQLTLQTKLEQPKAVPAASPTKTLKTQKSSTFSRLLSSPKKRREAEQRAAEEAEAARKQEAETQRRNASMKEASAWELLHDMVAEDGSFARAYVSLSTHAKHCFGRPFTVAVPCFNEWARETDPQITNSVRSKQRGMGGHGGIVRKPPYKIGKLELQLCYIPRVKGVGEEDMPRSLGAAVRELREAEREECRKWEGFLSQQGGDCPYWRRRLFKLSASKLTAYHEYTNQPRATINLAKAAALIDDKSTLIQPEISPAKEASPSKSKRRKSGFAEDEEGYMYVENGFRIRFANGEVIDFYADNAEDKAGWMHILSDVVGKGDAASSGTGGTKQWTQVVLAKEKTEGRKVDAPATGTSHARTNSVQRKQLPPNPPVQPQHQPAPPPQQHQPAHARTKSAPTSPMKSQVDRRPNSADDGLPIPHQQQKSQQMPSSAQAERAHYQHREREQARMRQAQTQSQAGSPKKRAGGPLMGKRQAVRSMIF